MKRQSYFYDWITENRKLFEFRVFLEDYLKQNFVRNNGIQQESRTLA